MANSGDYKYCLKDWNPLEEAYHDPNFNSYISGPGAVLDHDLQIPSKKSLEPRLYKLYIQNVPQTLTQIGIRNIFNHFGNTKEVILPNSRIPKKGTWALVIYDNLQSAQDAILALNSQPPYNLLVKFSVSEKMKEKLSTEKNQWEESSKPPSQFHDKTEEYANQERVKMGLFSMGLLPQTVTCNYIDGETFDIVYDYTFYNHYSGDNPADATHRFYSQFFFHNQMSDYLLSNNSETMVSTPVSYLTYHNRKINLETEKVLLTKPVYGKKNNGVYEFGEGYSILGKCEVCGSETSTSCKNCRAWYCGSKCLLENCLEHKLSCTPALNLSNASNSLMDELDLKNGEIRSASEQKQLDLGTEKTVPSSFAKSESITLFLKGGYTGLVLIGEKLCNSKYVVTLFCNQLPSKNFQDISDIVSDQPFDESFIPNIGEIVGVESSQELGLEWARGFVYTKGQAILCDFGNVVKYSKVKKLPEDLCMSPSLAVYCTVLESNKSKEEVDSEFIKDENTIKCVVMKCRSDGSVLASLKCESDNDLTGIMKFSPLTFFRHVVINNGSSVKLTAFYNCSAIYVQSLEPECVDIFELLMQDLGAYCQTEKSLDIEPALGDLVAVRYSKDGNWYRGQVLKKENGNFQVILVDFGNIETVMLECMKALNMYLKSVPCCAIRVGLSGILPKTSLTLHALQLLITLCETSQPMRIEFSSTDLNSVTLIRQGKLSLAEELENLWNSGWKKAVERELYHADDEVFMMNDLINCILTEGSEYQLRVLMWLPPNQITLCSTKCDLSKHVVGTLSHQLNEYSSALTSKSYNPRDGELCIVQLEDDNCWYRAVCLQTIFTTAQARVMFIDFGNICVVNHESIRRFCKDFINTPAMAIMCSYEGIPEKCTEALSEKMKELIQLNNEYTVLVKSLDEDTLYYNIDIPAVTSVLVKEQLLQL